jgi:peptidyl-prolyl cis-trans isomerase D
VIIITIPFALFGISSYFEGANQITVANVDGEKINAQTFERAMEQRRRFFRSQFGNNFDPAMVDNPGFRAQVVEGLVSNQLIQNYARETGLRLSDKALRERILSTPQFQVDGEFNQDAYRRTVSARGFTTEGYEQQERVSGGINQIQTGLSSSAIVNPLEVDQLLTLSLQQRDADYTVLAAKDYLPEIEVSDQEARDEYASNETDYQQADRIKLDYVTLTLADIVKDIELDDEEIEQAYEASKGKYIKPETRIASHILFSVPRSADDDKQQEVAKKAQDIKARIDGGEDFATLAEEFSDDPGSKRKGGDLGIIAKGQMVPEFEDAVFNMTQGDVSEPVKTEFGYHIIKLMSLAESSQQALDAVKAEVETVEKNRLAETQFTEIAETFRTLVFENPDSLDLVAQDLGLELQSSDWVTRAAGQGDFNNPRVRSAAFEGVVLDEDLNSEVVELSSDKLIAMHKRQFEAQHIKEFAAVKAQIESKLKNQKAAEIAQTRGAALMASIQADSIAEDVKFASIPTLKDEATNPIDRQLSAEIFKQSIQDDGETLIKGLVLNNGDYAVYRLKSITAGKPDQASKEQREQVVRQLEGRSGNNAYALFNQALREAADVEIFSSLLEDDADLSSPFQN